MAEPGGKLDAARLTECLEKVLSAPEFMHADRQVETLEALVRAAAAGRHLTGADLAQMVYGQSSERYVRAVQQIVREIRLKLPRYYMRCGPMEEVLRVSPRGYAVTCGPPVDSGGENTHDEPVVSPRADRPRSVALSRRWAAWAVFLVVLVPLSGWTGFRLMQSIDAEPDRVIQDESGIRLVDAKGRRLAAWTEAIEHVLPPGADPTDAEQARAVLLRRGSDGAPSVALVACKKDQRDNCTLVTIEQPLTRPAHYLPLPLLPDTGRTDGLLHEVAGPSAKPVFKVHSLLPAELDGDETSAELLVALAHQHSFPTQVLGLSLDAVRDGHATPIIEHWNMGSAYAMSLGDLSGDGLDEIVIYGTNNSFQAAFLTIIPSSQWRSSGPTRSPEGHRSALIEEVARLPRAGMTIRFPKSLLSNPSLRRDIALRNVARAVQWAPDRQQLTVRVADAAFATMSKRRLRLAFVLDLHGNSISVQFIDHDVFLLEIERLIAAGAIADNWNITDSDRLTRYGESLAHRVEMWDESQGGGWVRLDMANVRRALFGGDRMPSQSELSP